MTGPEAPSETSKGPGGAEAERLPARRSWLFLPENSQPVVKRWEGERGPRPDPYARFSIWVTKKRETC